MIGASPSGLNRDFLFNRGTSANLDVRGSASRDNSSTLRPKQRFTDVYSNQDDDDDAVSIDSSGIAQFERVMNRAATVYGRGGAASSTRPPIGVATAGGRAVSPGRGTSVKGASDSIEPPRGAVERNATNHVRRQHSTATTTSSNFVEDFQDENEWLRRKIRTLSEKYEQQLDDKELQLQKQQHEIRKLQKRIQKECPSVCGIGLADLHHSNERLSAQLSRLEVSAAAHENAAKVKECEDALESLLNELATVENKLRSQTVQWEGETQQLKQQLVSQQAEFNVERLECDRVVHAMSAKLEELGRENSVLRQQIQQGGTSSKSRNNNNGRNISSSSSNSST